MKILTAAQRSYLRQKHKCERDGRIRDRIKAILAYDEGYSYTEVAEILLLDDETIRRYVSDYLKKTKLKADHKGSRSKLDDKQSQQLVGHLLEQTYLYVKSICHYVELEFGVTYSVRGMTHWLHAQGFCYKKPHGVPAKADAQLQAEFMADYEELKTSLKPDEIICFSDCSHPQHQTRLAYGWIKKGVRKAEKMTACQKRVNLIGAINLENHAVTHGVVDWVNAESIKSFLGQLSKVYSDKRVVHLIWDNAGYHKSKEIREFVKKTNIQLHYLPPYSPNLNPIERLWKIMHEQVTYNRYYEKFKDFTEAITRFFENIEQYSEIIRSRITDNFQRLTAA